MKGRFLRKVLILFLAVSLISPSLWGCGRKITLDDAKYTMGKLFDAVRDSDYQGVARLMHVSTSTTASKVETYLSEVEEKVGGYFSDGLTNIRYTSYEELPYNGVPGGSKFRIYGTMNVGLSVNVPFIISLIMDGDGYGINVLDIGGVAL